MNHWICRASFSSKCLEKKYRPYVHCLPFISTWKCKEYIIFINNLSLKYFYLWISVVKMSYIWFMLTTKTKIINSNWNSYGFKIDFWLKTCQIYKIKLMIHFSLRLNQRKKVKLRVIKMELFWKKSPKFLSEIKRYGYFSSGNNLYISFVKM